MWNLMGVQLSYCLDIGLKTIFILIADGGEKYTRHEILVKAQYSPVLMNLTVRDQLISCPGIAMKIASFWCQNVHCDVTISLWHHNIYVQFMSTNIIFWTTLSQICPYDKTECRINKNSLQHIMTSWNNHKATCSFWQENEVLIIWLFQPNCCKRSFHTLQTPCRHVMSVSFRALNSKNIVTSHYVGKRSCQSIEEPLVAVWFLLLGASLIIMV